MFRSLLSMFLLAVVAIVLNSIPFRAHAEPASDVSTKCEALAAADFSQIPDAPTQVITTNLAEAAGDLPAYCRVIGYVAPNVGFELRLPSKWNEKFLQVGCGGSCGVALDGPFFSSCDSGVSRHYACIASDMGHKGAAIDELWAYGNLQGKIDWGFRGAHVTAIAGKAITEHYYATRPKRAYFMGCSTGGRLALQEAQHFPWDFDGLIAGAPPINLSTVFVTFAWGIRAIHDTAGNEVLGNEDLKLLTDAAVAQCDLDDGVKDGIIGNPLHCAFDPSRLTCKAGQTHGCLTPDQVESAKKIYSGPLTSNGMKLSLGGPLPGSERDQWNAAYVNAKALVTDAFRYLFYWSEPGPTWRLPDFDFERDYQRLALMQFLYDSSNPDLRQFKTNGGKLIVYQGMNDSAVLPRSTVDYYEEVERTMGGHKATQDFFRLFLLPGVNHCSGGAGADAVDFLGYLEAWTERGEAPDRMLSGHVKETSPAFAYPYREFPADPTKLSFTRPVYPYPQRAIYRGKGDPNDATNFGAVSH